MRTHPTRRRRQARGQSVAEMALVLPALLMLLLATLQIGFLLFTQVGLTNAAREASRNAASIPVVTNAQAATAASTYFDRLQDPVDGFLKRNVGGYDPTQLVVNPGTDTGTRVCYYSFDDASGAPAVMARVEVEYDHPIFIPLVGPIIDGWDGSPGGVRLSAVEDIRVGNSVLAPGETDIGDIADQTCNP